MRLDEAISHARHVSTRTDLCRKCRKQHEQLAGWLEELAKYRAENRRKLFTVFRCRNGGLRISSKRLPVCSVPTAENKTRACGVCWAEPEHSEAEFSVNGRRKPMGPDNFTPVTLYYVDPATGKATKLGPGIPELTLTNGGNEIVGCCRS